MLCGLGSIGKKHLRILHTHWNSLELAIYRSGHGPYSVEMNLVNCIFSTIEEAILWRPDAVIIASPASQHLSHALSFARCGIPLLIEKPIGIGNESQAEWDELNKEYKTQRVSGIGNTSGYPNFATQLDQLYHDMKDGKLGVAATSGSWFVGITSVKTAIAKT